MKLAIFMVAGLVGVIVLAVLLIALLGARLPQEHSATRSILLHQTPETVYGVARDFEAMPKWRSEVREVKITKDTSGPLRFREEGRHGAVNYELAEDLPARRMVTRITDTDLGYTGKWTYAFAAEGRDTRLTITEDGEVSNVIFRFLSRYAFGHTATIDLYLTSLARHFGENVRPQ